MSAPRPPRRRRPAVRRPNRRPARLHLEQVEPRTLLATFLVTNSDDAGPGSFRQAILDSNATIGFDTINFSVIDEFGDFGFQFVRLESPLPDVVDSVLIDGTTQPDFDLSDGDLFEIDGVNLDGADGLRVLAGGTTILGLSVVDFDGYGVVFSGPGGNRLDQGRIGDFFFIDDELFDQGNGAGGVLIDGSPNNTVGGSMPGSGNFIRANSGPGVSVVGAGATGNLVAANTIGLSAADDAGVNGEIDVDGVVLTRADGVLIDGAPNNTVGGTIGGAGNVIARNTGSGVRVLGVGAANNLIAGNTIGDLTGRQERGNDEHGITIDGAPGNTIGGTTFSSRNFISGNGSRLVDPINGADTGQGVLIVGATATGNLISGNFIGTDVTGSFALSNDSGGVLIDNAPGNTVGGTNASAAAIVNTGSVTGSVPILDFAPPAVLQIVFPESQIPLTDQIADVDVTVSLTHTFVGDLTLTLVAPDGSRVVLARNVGGSGDNFTGTVFDDQSSVRIEEGDPPFIGRFRPLVPLSNLNGRVATGTWRLEVLDSALIDQGTLTDFALTIRTLRASTDAGGAIGNLISGNGSLDTITGEAAGSGLVLRGAGAVGNVVRGNLIGTDANGTRRVNNFVDGLRIEAGASGNSVGGADPAGMADAFRNLISGNGSTDADGILVPGTGVGIHVIDAPGNVFQNNFVGTARDGAQALGNLLGGVRIEGVAATANAVGGSDPGTGNLISGNGAIGISSNDAHGLAIVAGATGNVVAGNRIGTDAAGTVALANDGFGLTIDGADDNTIGGASAAQSTTATFAAALPDPLPVPPSGTGGTGNPVLDTTVVRVPVALPAGSQVGDLNVRLAITHTFVGDLSIVLISPSGRRVTLADLVGGSGDNFTNTVFDDEADRSIFEGNAPFTGSFRPQDALSAFDSESAAGEWQLEITDIFGADLGEITLLELVFQVVVGGAGGAGNLISGNSVGGVRLVEGAAGNLLVGNLVGTDQSGGAPLPNRGDGVFLNATDNTVGGGAPGVGNVISGNLGQGLHIGFDGDFNRILGNFVGTDVLGAAVVANRGNGLLVDGPDNEIGGAGPGEGNVISGNIEHGVVLSLGADGNALLGNRIGVNASGSLDLPNLKQGVFILSAVNVIGGDVPGQGNEIVSNRGGGLLIQGAGAFGNLVLGNVIAGTTVEFEQGEPPATVTADGVVILKAQDNTIGGAAFGAGNAIRLNGRNGVLIDNDVLIDGAQATGNVVLGNLIDNNVLDGLLISGASRNVVGGAEPGAGNLVDRSGQNGIRILSPRSGRSPAQFNAVLGNTLTRNRQNGLFLEDADDTTVGVTRIVSAPQTFVAQDLPRPVPTAGTGGTGTSDDVTRSTVFVNQSGSVTDVNVTITLPHSFASDLSISLIAPDGLRLNLVSFAGFDETTGFLGTTFDDEAALSIFEAADPFTGTFRPEQPLSFLDGVEARGVWTLEVADLAALDTGLLTNFSLTLQVSLPTIDTPAGNVVNNNRGNGIVVRGQRNLVVGNFVGTDALGTTAFDELGKPLGNDQVGILVESRLRELTLPPRTSFGNTIGGTTPGARNIVSGNLGSGIEVRNAPRNLILGNFVGTDATGTIDLGNTGIGISIISFGGNFDDDTLADSNTIGGTTAAARNVILGSGGSGLQIAFSQGNLVQGNYIGTTADGRSVTDRVTGRPLGNFQDGISLVDSFFNTIGGADPDPNIAGNQAGNVISGNLRNGVAITVNSFDSDAGGQFIFDQANVVQGNFIGTDAAGTVDLGNALIGVFVQTQGNLIGGVNADPNVLTAGNLISGNDLNGIALEGRLARFNRIEGNFVGTNATGSAIASVFGTLGNAQAGVFLNDAPDNTIGGTAPGARNVISGNLAAGIQLFDGNDRSMARVFDDLTGTVVDRPVGGTLIRGNVIGLDVTGALDRGNSGNGIFLNEARGNTIGGPAPAIGATDPGNTIGGNDGSGIEVLEAFEGVASRAGGPGNLIERNRIGVDAAGTLDLGNNLNGIFVNQAPNNTIAGNVSAANNGFGILIGGGPAFGNRVVGNTVGLPSPDPNRPNRLGNALDGINLTGVGIDARDGLPFPDNGTTIGGLVVGEPNLSQFNGGDGLEIFGSVNVAVLGNVAQLNRGDGVRLTNTSTSTVRQAVSGASSIVASNIIFDNAGNGIALLGGTEQAPARGNQILANQITRHAGSGVIADGTQHDTLIRGNTIVDSKGVGIAVYGVQTNAQVIDNGVEASGGSAIGLLGTLFGPRIVDNRVVAALGDGIVLNAISVNADLIGNTVAGVVGSGLAVQGNSGRDQNGTPIDGARIVGNRVRTVFGGAGIDLAGTSFGAQIFNNGVEGAAVAGVLLQGSPTGATLGNNTITGITGGPGIDSAGRAVNLTVDRNTIAGAAGAGIDLRGPLSANVLLLNNRLTGGQGAGIDLRFNVQDANLVGNTIAGNVGAGLAIEGRSTRVSVRGNLIGLADGGQTAAPNLDGIFLNNVRGVTIGGANPGDRNVISGNRRFGVRIVQVGAVEGAGNVVLGNFIGTNAGDNGTNPGGNSLVPLLEEGSQTVGQRVGISIDGSPGNLILGNVVSGNGERSGVATPMEIDRIARVRQTRIAEPASPGIGIEVARARENAIVGNAIGGALGVDLFGVGVPLFDGQGGVETIDPLYLADAPSPINNDPDGRPVAQFMGVRQGIGVRLVDASSNSVTGNTITRNGTGVEVTGPNSTANLLTANQMPLNFVGVTIDGAAGNTVGGAAGAGNTITGAPGEMVGLFGSTALGVSITRSVAINNVVGGNQIRNIRGQIRVREENGTLAGAPIPGRPVQPGDRPTAEPQPVPVGVGVFIETAEANTIGGAFPNTIFNSRLAGVYLFSVAGAGPNANLVSNNTIEGSDDYGILLFNSINNVDRAASGLNRLRGNPQIANFREFTTTTPGPRLGTFRSAQQASTLPDFVPVQTPAGQRRRALPRGPRAALRRTPQPTPPGPTAVRN